ncbi:hypothetical protein BCR44DRAFT_1424525 [Catenaria anguillulae PL171]|uniref:Uncharacterized protein n=1 Tax=Catenaria anguillulae PL171 TaxID=765915 RepID=A0A1Y2HZZ0_9FUNG|nr:hypothetical protein BCR44DRAFT_1424525 [Catenaria anguillulae PL171]
MTLLAKVMFGLIVAVDPDARRVLPHKALVTLDCVSVVVVNAANAPNLAIVVWVLVGRCGGRW